MAGKNPHAVVLGRKGGLANKGKTSEAKAAASRENGKLGGRPKKELERGREKAEIAMPDEQELISLRAQIAAFLKTHWADGDTHENKLDEAEGLLEKVLAMLDANIDGDTTSLLSRGGSPC